MIIIIWNIVYYSLIAFVAVNFFFMGKAAIDYIKTLKK